MYELCVLDNTKATTLPRDYWGELRIFAELARTRSVAAAAERLGMSTPTMRRKARRLEDLVGATLFIWSGLEAGLTERGEELASAIVTLDASLFSIAADLRRRSTTPDPQTGEGSVETAHASVRKDNTSGEPPDVVELTKEEWDEAKRMAIDLVHAASLSTPEAHLAYVRGRLHAKHSDVV